jgi:hypothetical protein
MENKTAVEFLVDKWSRQGTLHSSDCKQALKMENERAQEYAEFAIRCDRMGMKILNFDDFIKLE